MVPGTLGECGEAAMPGQTVDLVELDRDLRFAERVRQRGEVIYERPDDEE